MYLNGIDHQNNFVVLLCVKMCIHDNFFMVAQLSAVEGTGKSWCDELGAYGSKLK